MSKLTLQVATGIFGAVPVLTGLIGMFGLSDPIYASAGTPSNALLDSNLRFFSGLWLGLGFATYWLIPKIEVHTVLFRVVWGMIFVGGIGRLLSMVFVALPPIPFIGFAVLELVGAPVFIVWQARVASKVRSA